MHNMKKILSTVFIILTLPFLVSARVTPPDLHAAPGALPGQSGYFFQNIREWLEINFFAVSTTAKQEKMLELSSRRLAEISKIASLPSVNVEVLNIATSHYGDLLGQAEDVAEKLVILDGAQLPVAEKLEQISRMHEQILLGLLQSSDKSDYRQLLEALNSARINNELIFKFMVKNYQYNQTDIAKYGNMVTEQIKFLREFAPTLPTPLPLNKQTELAKAYVELGKAEAAGLNPNSYDQLKVATDTVVNQMLPR